VTEPNGSAPQRPVSWLSMLRTVRAPLAILLIAVVVLLVPPQTQDMLAALADPGAAGISYTLSFHATLAFLSISAWYWARALLSARFDVADTDRGVELLAKEDPRVRQLPFEAVPRLMFVGALLLGVGLVFRSGLWIHLVYLALWGVPFLLLVVFRRQLRDRVPQRFRTLLRRAPWSSRVALVVIVFAFGVFLYGVAESFVEWGPGHAGLPALVAAWFPGPAAALLGFALMMAPLSTLTFLSDGWRIQVSAWGLDLGLRRPPIIWLLVAWVVIASAAFSIYTVRVVPDPGQGTQISQRADLADFFKAWVEACAPTGTIRPVVVAVSGGASRAAIWGERVLYQVEHSSEKTRPAVFAVSSVSGGSLGAAAYMTTLAGLSPQQRCGEDRLSPARGAALDALRSPRLAQDALGPLLAGALLVDIPRAIFSPFAWVVRWISNTQPRGGDRAEALERAFERLWRRLPVSSVDSATADKASLSQPFLSLFYDEKAIRSGMPIWIANGTELNTGSRLLTAPFDPHKSWPFNDAADALSALNADVRISTAINNTARFPFLEPAGELLRYPTDQKAPPEAIDGGYFDNEGLQTALELVDWIKTRGPELVPGRMIEPILVQATADSIVGVTSEQIVRCHSPRDDPTKASKTRRPLELLTPFLGLYKVLGAHSQVLLREAREKHCPNAFFHFYLPARDGKRVPLNWILSHGTAQYIWGAMENPLNSGNLDESKRLTAALQAQ
jgi:hypothetical protein